MPGFGTNAVLTAVTADLEVDGVPGLLIDDTGMLTGMSDVLVDDFADV